MAIAMMKVSARTKMGTMKLIVEVNKTELNKGRLDKQS